jgi:hypothetical protein
MAQSLSRNINKLFDFFIVLFYGVMTVWNSKFDFSRFYRRRILYDDVKSLILMIGNRTIKVGCVGLLALKPL